MHPRRLLIILALLAAAVPATADTIVLKNGRSLEGTILRQTPASVEIQIRGVGKMTVERSRIERILRNGVALAPPAARRPDPGPSVRVVPSGPVPEAATPRGIARNVLGSYRRALSSRSDMPQGVLVSHVAKLELLGRRATGDLAVALVEDRDWRVRLLAAHALRHSADPAATAALIHALGDEHYGAVIPDARDGRSRMRGGFLIQLTAVEALKAIGLKAYQGLLATAGDRDHPDHVVAIRGLGLVDVPGRAALLSRLAADPTLDREARRLAVTGLGKQGPLAARVLAELLAEEDVRLQAKQALKDSKDPAAIPGLMAHVRRAEEDHDLARAAAQVIAWTQSTYRPRKLEDAVDYMLLSFQIDRIGPRLGPPALSRLRHWASSSCEPMKNVARRALASFSVTNRPKPTPRPAPRPRRPSG